MRLPLLLGAAAAAAADGGPDMTRLGAMDFRSYESTPLLFHGELLLVETITLAYPRHMSVWFPEFKSCSSYFRVRELRSGAIRVNITQSCNHSFGSAFVDTAANGTETLWVFGSAWYRELGDWSGACAQPSTCTVGAFWTSDAGLKQWHSGAALAPGLSTYNVDVARGGPGQPYVMAAEHHPQPGAPAGSSWTTYFYVNDGTDGMLAGGWRPLPRQDHVLGGPGTHGACPSIRYEPSDGYYYVVSGGLKVYLDRSKDLKTWQPARNGGVVLVADKAKDTQVCTEYIGYQPTSAEAAKLQDPSWDVDVSDVDFWQLGDGSTIFFYLFGNQGNTIFSALGKYNGTLASWFQGHYDS